LLLGLATSDKNRPSLVGKKDLIFHTYESFLIAQTGLFVLAASNETPESEEISRRKELLLLDDLTLFAISGRRLVELSRLKSFASRCKVPLSYLDQREEPYVVGKMNDGVGFLTLVNYLINASAIKYIDTKFELTLHLIPMDNTTREKMFLRHIGNASLFEERIEPLIFVKSDTDKSVLISLRDVITTSTEVAEKVISACSDQSIFLEICMRDM
jgi:hypothetical protein